jgi:hypothetical protein
MPGAKLMCALMSRPWLRVVATKLIQPGSRPLVSALLVVDVSAPVAG